MFYKLLFPFLFLQCAVLIWDPLSLSLILLLRVCVGGIKPERRRASELQMRQDFKRQYGAQSY